MNRPTDEQLRGMISHIRYEIDEFRKGFERWVNLRPEDKAFNPTIEASLLHYRILRFFLITSAAEVSYEDDVVAAYYVDGDWPPAIPDILSDKKLQDEVNKRIAHLSIERLEPRDGWPAANMRKGIEDLIAEFKKRLKADVAAPFESLSVGTFEIGKVMSVYNATTTATFSRVFGNRILTRFFVAMAEIFSLAGRPPLALRARSGFRPSTSLRAGSAGSRSAAPRSRPQSGLCLFNYSLLGNSSDQLWLHALSRSIS